MLVKNSMDKSIVPAKTFVLKANIHCSGCEKKMKKLLQRVTGVHSISIDADQSKITISGTIDPQTVVKFLEDNSKVKSELLWEPTKEKNNLQIIDQQQLHENTYYGIDHDKDFVEQLQQISEIRGVKSVELTRDKLKLTFKEHIDDNNCKDRHVHGTNCCAKNSTRAMHGNATNMSQYYNGNHGTCYARNSTCAMHYCNECGLPQVSPCRCRNSHANIPVGLPWRPDISPSAPPEYYDTPPPPPPPMTAYWYWPYDNSFSDENPRGCTIM